METKHLRKDDLVYYDGKPVKLNDLWQDFLQGLQTKSPKNHKHVLWDLRSEKHLILKSRKQKSNL